ncbi:MAG: alpha/beta hydrolase, partial [Bacteroidota bacterium]
MNETSALEKYKKVLSFNGMQSPVLDYGKGEPVLCIHGFPDNHKVWRKQVKPLAEAGYRVIAPDMRGFGEASKPLGVENYVFPIIMQDVLALLDQLGLDKVHLLGHDYGAALSWRLAFNYPSRFHSFTSLSVGAPRNPGWTIIPQREKNWYYCLFRTVGTAEKQLSHNNFQLMRDWMREHEDVEDIIAHFSQVGHLTAALNWYRAFSGPIDPKSIAP